MTRVLSTKRSRIQLLRWIGGVLAVIVGALFLYWGYLGLGAIIQYGWDEPVPRITGLQAGALAVDIAALILLAGYGVCRWVQAGSE